MHDGDLIPNAIVCCVLALLFVELAPQGRGWCRDVAVIWLLGTTFWYVWRRLEVLPGSTTSGVEACWQWTFAATEGVAVLYECWTYFTLQRISNHSERADAGETAFRSLPPTEQPDIAIFIPTIVEPLALLKITLKAAAEIAGSYRPGQVTVYCLDDGKYPNEPGGKPRRQADEAFALEAFCNEQGVIYLARECESKGRAKAGNLQYAYAQTRQPIIVVLDCDFHVAPRFLPRVVGLLLRDPKLGLVQVPQSFINPDPIAFNLQAADALCDTQAAFMQVVQPGRDHFDNAFCVGSGWAAKRSAIDAIGGFKALVTVGEDLELTYRLKLRGYRTCYLNEPLAFGLAAESLSEFVTQQVRWCWGSLQQIFLPSGPVRGKHGLKDRLFYLDTPLFWLTHLATIQVLLAPIIFWHFRIQSIPDPDNRILEVMIIRLTTRAALVFWLTNGRTPPLVAAVSKALAAFPVLVAICLWIVFNVQFRPTCKCKQRATTVIYWPLFLIFASLAALTLGGMLSSERMEDGFQASAAAPINYLWSLLTLAVAGLAMLVCIERPTKEFDYLSSSTIQRANLVQAAGGIFRRICGNGCRPTRGRPDRLPLRRCGGSPS